MSGLEIAGLVIGAIPVCAAALEEIKEVADSLKRFKDWRLQLPLLVERLNQEGVHLFYVLQLLCSSVGERLDEKRVGLRGSAGGQLWPSKELSWQLRAKHGKAYDLAVSGIRDIERQVSCLCRELGLGAITEVSCVSIPSETRD